MSFGRSLRDPCVEQVLASLDVCESFPNVHPKMSEKETKTPVTI